MLPGILVVAWLGAVALTSTFTALSMIEVERLEGRLPRHAIQRQEESPFAGLISPHR